MIALKRAALLVVPTILALSFFPFTYAELDEADKACRQATVRESYDRKDVIYPNTYKEKRGTQTITITSLYHMECDDKTNGKVSVKGQCEAFNVCAGKKCLTPTGTFENCKKTDVKVDQSKNQTGDNKVPPPALSDTGDVSGGQQPAQMEPPRRSILDQFLNPEETPITPPKNENSGVRVPNTMEGLLPPQDVNTPPPAVSNPPAERGFFGNLWDGAKSILSPAPTAPNVEPSTMEGFVSPQGNATGFEGPQAPATQETGWFESKWDAVKSFFSPSEVAPVTPGVETPPAPEAPATLGGLSDGPLLAAPTPVVETPPAPEAPPAPSTGPKYYDAFGTEYSSPKVAAVSDQLQLKESEIGLKLEAARTELEKAKADYADRPWIERATGMAPTESGQQARDAVATAQKKVDALTASLKQNDAVVTNLQNGSYPDAVVEKLSTTPSTPEDVAQRGALVAKMAEYSDAAKTLENFNRDPQTYAPGASQSEIDGIRKGLEADRNRLDKLVGEYSGAIKMSEASAKFVRESVEVQRPTGQLAADLLTTNAIPAAKALGAQLSGFLGDASRGFAPPGTYSGLDAVLSPAGLLKGIAVDPVLNVTFAPTPDQQLAAQSRSDLGNVAHYALDATIVAAPFVSPVLRGLGVWGDVAANGERLGAAGSASAREFNLGDTVASNAIKTELAARDFGAGPISHVADTPVGPVFAAERLPLVADTVTLAQRDVIEAIGGRALTSADRAALVEVGLQGEAKLYGRIEAEVTTRAGVSPERVSIQRTAFVNAEGEVVAVRSRVTGSDAARFEPMNGYEIVAPVENRGVFASVREKFNEWFGPAEPAPIARSTTEGIPPPAPTEQRLLTGPAPAELPLPRVESPSIVPPEPVAPQYARAGNDFYKIDTETGSLTKITDAGVTEALQAKGLTEIPASQIAGERAIAAEAVRLGELTTQDIAATEARIAALPKGNETIVSAGSAAESSVVRGAANQGFPREGFLEVDGQYSKYSVSPSGRIDTSPITDPQAIAMLSEGQGFTRTTASAVAQDVVEARAAADAAASTGNAKVVDLAAQEKVAAAARDAQLVKLLDQEIADTQAKIAALPKGNETIVSARDAADSASVRNAARQGFSSEGYLEVNGRYSKYSVSPNGNISTTPITDPVAIKMLSEGEGFTRTTASAVARDAAEARAAANIAANAEAAEARLANLLDQERAAAAAQDTRLAKLIEQEIADTRAQNTRFADAMNRDLANAQAKSNATTQARAAEFDALARYDGPIVSASNLAELQKALNGNVARSPGGSGGGLSVTNPSGSGAARGTPVGTAPTGVSPVSVLEKTISDFKILPLPPVSEIPTIVAQDIRSGIGNVTRTVEDAVVAVRNGTADVFDKLGLAKAGDAIRVPSSAGVKVTESPALAKNQLIQQVSNPALSSTLPQWLQSNAYGIGRGSNFYDGKDVAGAPVTTERTTTGGLTQEFNDWLNGSIFVDKKGNPITLYHVSAQPISAFDINNSNEIGLHVGTVDTVLTVADKPMLSPKNNSTISPTTYSFVLNVKNPLRIPDLTAFLLDTPRFQNAVVTAIARDQILAGRTEYAAENGKVVSALRQEVNNVQQPSDVRKILKSYGYDAIIYANTLESGGKKVQFNSTTGKYVEIPDDGQYADSLILLDPARQVRSAITGNYIWDPSTGIALDQSAPATEPAVPADVNVPLAWLPFATVPNLARAVVLATMSFNPVVGNLVGAILPASSEPIQVAPAVPSSVSQVANSTVPLSVEEIAEAKTAIEDISTRIGNPKYGEIDARDFVAEVEKESTLYLPGSPKTRALVDTYINPEPQRMNEYYFTASDYAALEKLYGNPRAFAQTFFAQRPKLFIERVLGYDGLAGNNFSATDISKDYAWLVPSVANAVIADMPEYLLSGLGASQSVMPTILRYVMPYVDTATGARMVGAIHARIETADIHSLFRMPDSVISFAYGNAQSPQTVRVQLIRQALKSGTFDERLSKALDLEQELSNAVSAKTPEKAMLSYYDALSMEYMNTSLDVVMSLPTSHRLQQFLVDMLDFATRPEPRSVFDDDFRRQTINNDLQRARQTAPSPIAAYPTAETIMRGLFGLDRFLQTRNYPGTADLFVTAYVNNAARADLAGSAISLLDTDTVRILNGYSSPTSYAVRTELLDTTSIKNAIAKYTPAQQRRSFSLIEQLVPDKAYLVQKLRELVVGNSNPNAVAMLTSYAELFMSNREELMAASKLTSLIEDGFRNDVWQMRVSGARTDDLIQTNSIDEDIRKAFADNQLTKPVIALINAGQIAPYDFAIARRGDLADLLHTGGEYILQYMADALPVWQTDSQNLVSLRKTADYLLNAKYPLIEIRSLLMQGFPKDAAQAWEKFGRVYPTDRSPGVSRDWENVPLAKTFHLTSDYLFNRNSYATLQPFEIAQADAYARLFRFLENSGRTDLETEMITNLNLSKFDVDAGNRIAAGEVPQLFKEIRTMGNTVTPQMQRTLGERVMQNHSAELAAYFEKNGIIKPDGTMRVTVPQLGAVAAYMDILQIQRSVRNLYDRLDNTISFIDPTSIDVSSISPASITSLDDFLKVYGTLNSIRDAFGLNGRTVRFDDTGGMKTAKTALDALVQELSDRAPQVFASAQTGTSIPDPSTIEPFRADLNRTTRGAGDDVLKKVAESFIDNAKDIDALLEFGRSWSAFGDKRGGDIAELYKLPAGFAFNQAYSLLLAKPELLTPARATIFDQNGFSTAPNQGLVGKAISRIASGKAVTTGQRIVSRVLGTTPETAVGTVAKMPYEKPLRDHATAEYLCVGDCSANTAEALLVTVDAEKGAARLEASKSGMVDTDTIAKQMSGSLVFHAPVSFTTGARRVMDVAFKSGVAVGSFVKTDGRDGIIVANAAGKVVVVNKRNLRLGDLTKVGVPVAPEDMDVRIDITRSLGEYRRFFDLMQTNKLSGLTNMLLAENGVPSPTAILDANDSRRMFVVMSDGSIGVVSSLKNMPTNRLLSLALAAGAHDVIYMDTGMYDMASLTDKNGGNRVLGHKDSQDSTNRLFLYVPDTTPGSLSVPIEVPTTQVTNIQPQGKTVASIFGTPTDKLKGNNTMASGQKIDYTQNKGLFVVAHKTLPFGTEVLIRNPANGKTVVAQVGERGSYVAGRELDLFETVAKELGFGIGDKGVIAVEWAVIPNSAKGVTPYKAGRTDLGDLSKNGPLGITAGLSDASTKYAAVFAPNKAVAANTVSAPPVAVPPSRPAPARVAATVRPPVVTTTLEEPFTLAAYKITPAAPSKTVVELRDKVSGIANQIEATNQELASVAQQQIPVKQQIAKIQNVAKGQENLVTAKAGLAQLKTLKTPDAKELAVMQAGTSAAAQLAGVMRQLGNPALASEINRYVSTLNLMKDPKNQTLAMANTTISQGDALIGKAQTFLSGVDAGPKNLAALQKTVQQLDAQQAALKTSVAQLGATQKQVQGELVLAIKSDADATARARIAEATEAMRVGEKIPESVLMTAEESQAAMERIAQTEAVTPPAARPSLVAGYLDLGKTLVGAAEIKIANQFAALQDTISSAFAPAPAPAPVRVVSVTVAPYAPYTPTGARYASTELAYPPPAPFSTSQAFNTALRPREPRVQSGAAGAQPASPPTPQPLPPAPGAAQARATREKYLQDPVIATDAFRDFARLPLQGLDAEIQEASIAQYLSQKDTMLKDYIDHFGHKVINPDLAYLLFRPIGYEGANVAAVQKASSALAQDVWRDALKNNLEPQVVLLAGGSGAGKSTTVRNVLPQIESQAAAIVDGTSANALETKQKIEDIIAAGKVPEVVYIYRDPLDAWENGMISRMNGTSLDAGRVVPISIFASTHKRSWQVVKDLLQDERVHVSLIDNSRGVGNAVLMTPEEFAAIKYPSNSQLNKALLAKTEELLGRGVINAQQYATITGAEAPAKLALVATEPVTAVEVEISAAVAPQAESPIAPANVDEVKFGQALDRAVQVLNLADRFNELAANIRTITAVPPVPLKTVTSEPLPTPAEVSVPDWYAGWSALTAKLEDGVLSFLGKPARTPAPAVVPDLVPLQPQKLAVTPAPPAPLPSAEGITTKPLTRTELRQLFDGAGTLSNRLSNAVIQNPSITLDELNSVITKAGGEFPMLTQVAPELGLSRLDLAKRAADSYVANQKALTEFMTSHKDAASAFRGVFGFEPAGKVSVSPTPGALEFVLSDTATANRVMAHFENDPLAPTTEGRYFGAGDTDTKVDFPVVAYRPESWGMMHETQHGIFAAARRAERIVITQKREAFVDALQRISANNTYPDIMQNPDMQTLYKIGLNRQADAQRYGELRVRDELLAYIVDVNPSRFNSALGTRLEKDLRESYVPEYVQDFRTGAGVEYTNADIEKYFTPVVDAAITDGIAAIDAFVAKGYSPAEIAFRLAPMTSTREWTVAAYLADTRAQAKSELTTSTNFLNWLFSSEEPGLSAMVPQGYADWSTQAAKQGVSETQPFRTPGPTPVQSMVPVIPQTLATIPTPPPAVVAPTPVAAPTPAPAVVTPTPVPAPVAPPAPAPGVPVVVAPAPRTWWEDFKDPIGLLRRTFSEEQAAVPVSATPVPTPTPTSAPTTPVSNQPNWMEEYLANQGGEVGAGAPTAVVTPTPPAATGVDNLTLGQTVQRWLGATDEQTPTTGGGGTTPPIPPAPPGGGGGSGGGTSGGDSAAKKAPSFCANGLVRGGVCVVGGLVVVGGVADFVRLFQNSTPAEKKAPDAKTPPPKGDKVVPPPVPPPGKGKACGPNDTYASNGCYPPYNPRVTPPFVNAVPNPNGPILDRDYYCITNIDPVMVVPLAAGSRFPSNCINSYAGNPNNNPFANLGQLLGRLFGTSAPTPTPATATKPPVTPPSATSAPPKPFATLIAQPTIVLSGKKSQLIWSSVNTSNCELFTPDNMSMATGTRGSTSTLALATTTLFRLDCSAPAGATTSAQAVVTVQ